MVGWVYWWMDGWMSAPSVLIIPELSRGEEKGVSG